MSARGGRPRRARAPEEHALAPPKRADAERAVGVQLVGLFCGSLLRGLAQPAPAPLPRGAVARVGDAPGPCAHPAHAPQGVLGLDPGVYDYACPGCGGPMRFTVPER